eukprot:1029234-Prymnesium_polylepis.1
MGSPTLVSPMTLGSCRCAPAGAPPGRAGTSRMACSPAAPSPPARPRRCGKPPQAPRASERAGAHAPPC